MSNITMGKTTCSFRGIEFSRKYLMADFFNYYFDIVKDEIDFLDNRSVEIDFHHEWRKNDLCVVGCFHSETGNIVMLSKDMPCLSWNWQDAPEGSEFRCNDVYGRGDIYRKYVVNEIPFLIREGSYRLRDDFEQYFVNDTELVKLSIETTPDLGNKIMSMYLGSLRYIW